jgi:hypothetical protein
MLLDLPEDFILPRVFGFLLNHSTPSIFGVDDEFLSGGTVSAEVLINYVANWLEIVGVVAQPMQGGLLHASLLGI